MGVLSSTPPDLSKVRIVHTLNKMTVVDLRKECTAKGIRWRNAHGQGKHLTKALMIVALTVL